MMLVQDEKGRAHVAPSLENIKYNACLLRPFTRVMAETGRIRKPIHLIKEALSKFYKREGQVWADDNDVPETMEAKLRRSRNMSKTADTIKSMLTVIKRKWSKWELPREDEVRAMVLDMAEAVSKAYSEGRCALERSPKIKQGLAASCDEDSVDMADDASLREGLHSMAKSSGSQSSRALEECLTAPPQAELEKVLGFSLNPESYRRLLKDQKAQEGALGASTGADDSTKTGEAEKAGEATDVAAVVAAEEDGTVPGHVDPGILSQVLMSFDDLPDDMKRTTPRKEGAKPDPLSPGSPGEPCLNRVCSLYDLSWVGFWNTFMCIWFMADMQIPHKVEIVSFLPAPASAGRTKSPATPSLAQQLSSMDPARLKEILAVVNMKL
ncbi:unnamed protein product [Symbiodinium sp. CCMP2456]|nr:unnamed protein product [Symbiodinium sp. CCMP2456]